MSREWTYGEITVQEERASDSDREWMVLGVSVDEEPTAAVAGKVPWHLFQGVAA
jgi:hypothetical protein